MVTAGRRERQYTVETYDWIDALMGFIGAVAGVAAVVAPIVYLAVR